MYLIWMDGITILVVSAEELKLQKLDRERKEHH